MSALDKIISIPISNPDFIYNSKEFTCLGSQENAIPKGKVFHLLDPDPEFTKTIRDSKDMLKLFRNSNAVAMCEFQLQLFNLKMILRHSNATIIRHHTDVGYSCYFCEDCYVNAADLKKHTLEEHINPKLDFYKLCLKQYGIKMDITKLTCKLCDKGLDSIEMLMEHLNTVHSVNLYKDLKNYIMSFKFETEQLTCTICSKEFNSFNALLLHMNPHYRNFVCDICDEGFINRSKLCMHKDMHKVGTHKCGFCTKVFDTKRKMQLHQSHVHSLKHKHRCRLCNETFKEFRHKRKHLVEKHGSRVVEYQCQACDRVYTNKATYNLHMKRDHLMERPFECTECQKTFSAKATLENHMLTHLKMKMFECEICKKSYATKKSLKEHIKIHNNDRRWKCQHCGQAFVQKCSLKGHLRSKHDRLE